MSHNDITGDKIATKHASDKFRENYDAIFKKKPVDADTCGKCGQPWLEHEFAVPAPYCPITKVYPGGALPAGDCA